MTTIKEPINGNHAAGAVRNYVVNTRRVAAALLALVRSALLLLITVLAMGGACFAFFYQGCMFLDRCI